MSISDLRLSGSANELSSPAELAEMDRMFQVPTYEISAGSGRWQAAKHKADSAAVRIFTRMM